jgi:uncharacterized protein with HEPN domain
MRPEERLLSRLRDIQLFGKRAKAIVDDRTFDAMQEVEREALCYLVLVVTEATIQALGLDDTLTHRYPEIPWRQIGAMGNQLRHGYASLDLEVVHDVVNNGNIDQMLAFARSELEERGG